MRVLHIIPNLERGGAERVLLGISKYCLKCHIEVKLCVLGTKNLYPEETTDRLSPEILGFSLSYRNPLYVLAKVRRLRRLIRDWQPDIVHSHLWPAARMAGWALKTVKIPHLVHIHDTMGWLSARNLRSRMMRLLTRTALRNPNTYFVAVGRSVADYTRRYLRWIPDRIEVIYNGFDVERFARGTVGVENRPTGPGRMCVLGTAARLVPNKGIDVLLRALQKAALPCSWELRIAGDGSQRNALEELSGSLAIGHQVRFFGTVTDMGEFYAQLDLYIQPSLFFEGLPLVLTEAMACGVPVIATDVGAARELVRDGTDGFIVPPGDVESLADAIRNLAENIQLRQKMGQNARQRVWAEFSSDQMGRKTVELYKTILKGRARSTSRG